MTFFLIFFFFQKTSIQRRKSRNEASILSVTSQARKATSLPQSQACFPRKLNRLRWISGCQLREVESISKNGVKERRIMQHTKSCSRPQRQLKQIVTEKYSYQYTKLCSYNVYTRTVSVLVQNFYFLFIFIILPTHT